MLVTAISKQSTPQVLSTKILFRTCSLLAKRTASRIAKQGRPGPSERLRLCLSLLDEGDAAPELRNFIRALAPLDIDDKHYWVGTFYTLLLAPDERRKQSAYFTPPPIARHLLRLAELQGINFATAKVLDPAAGGAAFLSMVAAKMREAGSSVPDILRRLRGIEIDPCLAELARTLIAKRLGVERIPPYVVKVGDALAAPPSKDFDLVIANPPYGRVSPLSVPKKIWGDVCHPGHINLYALFVDLCLKAIKADGVVNLVIPSSFIAGPLYCKLRKSIRQRAVINCLAQVQCREEFFLDVMQDVSLLSCTKRDVHSRTVPQQRLKFARIDQAGKWTQAPSINLPAVETSGWLLPSPAGGARGGATLADYGCRVSAGYFVWNREKKRMTDTAERGKAKPLFWASNVRSNESCKPHKKKGKGIDYVRFDIPGPGIIKGPSLLIQRTTNTKQARRLFVGKIDKGPFLKSGYVTENHTIVVRPTRKDANLDLVCRLLNSKAVDSRYRQMSGTASISTLLLRELDLPHPDQLKIALRLEPDFEAAVERAYTQPASKSMAA